MNNCRFFHIGTNILLLGILLSSISCDRDKVKNSEKKTAAHNISEVQISKMGKGELPHTVLIEWPCTDLINSLREDGLLKEKELWWNVFKQDNPDEWRVAVDLINLSNMDDYKQGNLSEDELSYLFDCRISKYIYDTHRQIGKNPETEIENYCRIIKSFIYTDEPTTEEENKLMDKLDEQLGHFRLFHFEIKILSDNEISNNPILDSLFIRERMLWKEFAEEREKLYSELVLGKESCWGQNWSSLQQSMLESFDLEQDHQRENVIFNLYCTINGKERLHAKLFKMPSATEMKNALRKVSKFISRNKNGNDCNFSSKELKSLLFSQNDKFEKYMEIRESIATQLNGSVRTDYEQSTDYIASTQLNYLGTITTNDVDFGYTSVKEDDVDDELDDEAYEYD